MSVAAEAILVALFGAAVGMGELASRYRDAPAAALRTSAAYLYVGLNALASAGLLWLLHAFDWKLGTSYADNSAALAAVRAMAAGFGAMAIFRSSLFVVRAGSQDVAIGPSSFLQMTLGAVDRAVDRARAQVRADSVAEIMQGLVFDDVDEALPTFALALMQNLPEEDQKQLANKVLLLQGSSMTNETKVLVLGLELMNVVGPETLEATVSALKKSVAPPPKPSGGGP